MYLYIYFIYIYICSFIHVHISLLYSQRNHLKKIGDWVDVIIAWKHIAVLSIYIYVRCLWKNRSRKLNRRGYDFANIKSPLCEKSYTMFYVCVCVRLSIYTCTTDGLCVMFGVWVYWAVCVKYEVKSNEIRAGTTLVSFISANKPVLPNRLWSSKVKPDKPSHARWRERQLHFVVKGYTVHACQNVLCGQTFQNHWITGWLGQ